MDNDDRIGNSVRRVASSGAGVGASAMVDSVGAGWERLADMKRAVDQPTRGEAGECFAQSRLGLCKKIEKGILVILPNIALVTFCQPAAQDSA